MRRQINPAESFWGRLTFSGVSLSLGNAALPDQYLGNIGLSGDSTDVPEEQQGSVCCSGPTDGLSADVSPVLTG